MEHVRMLLAIVLSFLVFFLYQYFFVDEQAIEQAQQAQQAQQAAPVQPMDQGTQPAAPAPQITPPATPTPAPPGRAPRIITIDTPYYVVKISEQGAVITSFTLKKYRETVEADAPYKELVSPSLAGGTLQTALGAQDANALYTTDLEDNILTVTDQSRALVFRTATPTGVVLEKAFQFSPQSYLVDLAVTVKNGGPSAINDRLAVQLSNVLATDNRAYGFIGPGALIDDRLEQVAINDIEDQNQLAGTIQWMALQGRYFMTSLIAPDAPKADLQLAANEQGVVDARYLAPAGSLPSGSQQTHEFKLFFGPKSTQLLGQLGFRLNKAVNFGMFDIIAKPCLWFMNQIYGIIPNYGIAIILLTVATKVLLWPLGNKSYKSMNAMKKLTPLMTEIREKYKDDRKKMNEEVMALYRTYKINPLGGCLPMVAQIPVFFALYRMLYEAIELRHAPFFLWINDLSAPDRLGNFGLSIPLMEPPYGIPVLTIIMGATMFLQQKMSPPPGDPTQAKMMMFLPIVFTVIFVNFSSGLVLYWLVNNVLSISQQYYVQQKAA